MYRDHWNVGLRSVVLNSSDLTDFADAANIFAETTEFHAEAVESLGEEAKPLDGRVWRCGYLCKKISFSLASTRSLAESLGVLAAR